MPPTEKTEKRASTYRYVPLRRIAYVPITEAPHGGNAVPRSDAAAPQQSIAERLGLEKIDVEAILRKKDKEIENAEKSRKWFYRSLVTSAIASASIWAGKFSGIADATVFTYGLICCILAGTMSALSVIGAKTTLNDKINRLVAISFASGIGVSTSTLIFETPPKIKHNWIVVGLISVGLSAVSIILVEFNHGKKISDLEMAKN